MSPFQPLDLNALFALELPPVEYAVDGLFPLGAATLFSAREKAGKGLFAIDMCASVAFEEPFLDRAVRPGPAIYCAAEENIRDVRARIEMRVGHRRDGPLHVLPLDGSTGERLNLSDAQSVQRLYNMAKTLEPVVLVVDVLREVHTGREDISDDMSPLLRPLRQIAHDLNIALVVNHHMNKAGSFRGSTAIAAAFDVVAEMNPDDPPASEGIVATLRVNGRYGRSQLRIQLGAGLRWRLAEPTVTVGDDSVRTRILQLLGDRDRWMTADEITAIFNTPLIAIKQKTIQNHFSTMLNEDPSPIVTEGRGVRGDPRRYRLPQPGLFPQDEDPLEKAKRGNSRDTPDAIVPDPSRNNGKTSREWSEAEWEDVAV